MMATPQFPNAHILIVDDEPVNLRLLERLLGQAGYQQLHSTTDPREVLALSAAVQPDIVLLDLHMPYVDGFTVIQQLRQHLPAGTYLPILALTADVTISAKERALAAGAQDFLTKPFERTEVLLRIHNLLETRIAYRHLQQHNQLLEERVQTRTQELAGSHVEMLERLAQAAEYRDDATGQHTQRVGQVAVALAGALELSARDVELIRLAAPLHDLGKIAIPDTILLKPGRLTPDERDVMQTHTTVGAALLARGRADLMQLAETIALTHHERWDGSGYPQGLVGAQIPLAGRIVAIADVFDALTHDRPYKGAWSTADAVIEITAQAGRHFDPQVVEAWMRTMDFGRPAWG